MTGMKCFYDFHIHSCLSPCADMDMTPNNIVNMAKLKGLDAIAITDHNSCQNAQAVMHCGEENGLLVLPGMEIETVEEIHILALFANLQPCIQLERLVRSALTPIENKPHIFGEQWILDAEDRHVGTETQLLVTAAALDVYETVRQIHELGGIAVAAHVDKTAYSVVSALGLIPPDLPLDSAELSKHAEKHGWGTKDPRLNDLPVLQNSDAHYLVDISEPDAYLSVDTLDRDVILRAIALNRR